MKTFLVGLICLLAGAGIYHASIDYVLSQKKQEVDYAIANFKEVKTEVANQSGMMQVMKDCATKGHSGFDLTGNGERMMVIVCTGTTMHYLDEESTKSYSPDMPLEEVMLLKSTETDMKSKLDTLKELVN